MRLKTICIASAAMLSAHGVATAQHFDVRPFVDSGKIFTGGHDDATGDQLPLVSVFGYDFGEDPADPYFTQDPGFNAEAGSGLPGGSQLLFNLLGPLGYWDGDGSPSFAAPPAGESILLNFGASNRTVTGSTGFQAGFSLQTVNANGSVHRHLNAFLQGADGNSIPAGPGAWGAGDGVEAPDGIYLLQMQLASSGTSISASDAFWIVFNNGLDEELHDEAIEYVEATFVPEPGSLAVVSLVGLSLLRRRR